VVLAETKKGKILGDYMIFLKRIWNVIVGRATTLAEAIENPEDQLRLFVSTLDSEMSKLRMAVVIAVAEEKKLKKKSKACWFKRRTGKKRRLRLSI